MPLSEPESAQPPTEDEAEPALANPQVASATNAVAGEPTDENQSDLDIGSGQTRMEVAYGAGDGDDDAKAVVARKASLGILFEQIYRPWNGNLGPRWVRNYAIFRHHVYRIFPGCLLYTTPSPRERG